MTPNFAQVDAQLSRTKAIAITRASMFIYVIGREEGPVKVGISSSPNVRLAQLKTGCPFPIAVLHAVPMLDRDHALKHEADFHAVYAKERLSGEWFDIDADHAIDLIETGLEHEAYFQIKGRTA